MRGLRRISNYYNRQAAWRDWHNLVNHACAVGRSDLVDKYRPPADAGWRTIDKLALKLKRDLEQHAAK